MADIRIIIVDDHPIVLEALNRVFSETAGFAVLATCVEGAQMLRAVESYKPDILLLDARLPDLDGVLAIPRVLAKSPHTRVVMFTATLDEAECAEALEMGAKAVLLKTTPAEQIIQTLHRVAADADNRLVPAQPRRSTGLNPTDISALSPRERDVATRVARGARNKEIAWELGLAEGTVKLYISRAFRKLGVRNRVGLSRAAGSLPRPAPQRSDAEMAPDD
jgi:two-component system, NarL family, nitrate/nitrite response regulator NarL